MIDRQRFKQFKFSELDFKMLDKYEAKGWKFIIEESYHPHNGDEDEYFTFQSPRMSTPSTMWITPFSEEELIDTEKSKVLWDFFQEHERAIETAVISKLKPLFDGDTVPNIKDALKLI